MPVIYKNNINYGGVTYLAGSGVTAGIITAYGGTTAPTGWLLCNGSAISRETYSELFKAIGTTYGSGDGSTTFNLPDLRGAFPVGADSSIDVGDTGGEKDHTLTIDEMPSHTHDIAGSTSTGASDLAVYGSSRVGTGYNIALARGGGQAHNNMPPYTAVNYIISIGQQNGGFTHIAYDSIEDEYNGGVGDKYLLTQDTIDDLVEAGYAASGDESGTIDKALGKLVAYAVSDTSGVGYVKSPSGTMICYGSYASSNVWSNQIGFAQEFVDTPKVIPIVIANVSTPIGFTVLTVTTTNFTLSYSTSTGSKTINWIAIGKWK